MSILGTLCPSLCWLALPPGRDQVRVMETPRIWIGCKKKVLFWILIASARSSRLDAHAYEQLLQPTT